MNITKLHLLIIFVLIANCCSAQTNTLPSSGNVGIATGSPSYNLQVEKTSALPAMMIGGAYPGSPRFQIYGLNADPNAWMGFGTDMGGGPYEHSIYFPNYMGKLTIGDYNGLTYNTRMTVLNSGNIGIGAAAPSERLSIGDETPGTGRNVLRIGAASYAEPAAMNANSAGDKIILYDNVLSSYDARIGVGDRANFWMKSFCGSGSNYGSFEWYTGTDNNNPKLVLSGSGNLSIGTSNAQNYKLAVNGSAIATSMTVKLFANWPDYVFNPTYSLPSLKAIKTYIDQNHHLPDMPSAEEVLKNGLNLGEVNALLTKKVEELTLYLIKQNKQLTAQQKINKNLQKQINKLGKKLH